MSWRVCLNHRWARRIRSSLATSIGTVLAYYIEDVDPGWDGSSVRVVGPTEAGEPIALVRFEPCYAQMFGPPNDEAFSGHPLASRGLRPYGAYEVTQSSWIRRHEKIELRSPPAPARHVPQAENLSIFTFHDSTFECVCDRFDVTLARGSIESVVPEMVKRLAWRAG